MTGGKIVAAINKDPSMPVIATNPSTDSPVITLTCKWKGVEGNRYRCAPRLWRPAGGRTGAGRSAALRSCQPWRSARLASSWPAARARRTSPSGLDNLGDEIYEYVATGFTDSTSLALLATEYGFGDEGRWGWLRQLYGHVFGAVRGAGATDQWGYTELIAYGPTNNSGVLSLMAVENAFANADLELGGGLCGEGGAGAAERSGASVADAGAGELLAGAEASAL